MSRFRAVSITVLLSAFLIAPAIAGAADEADLQDQTAATLATEEVILEDQAAAAPVTEEVQLTTPVLAPTPKAAIDWNQMEAARRDARDRAQALRQQSILNETQAQPAQ